MRDGFKIIDCDRHVVEPEDLWDRYLEAPFKHYGVKGSKFSMQTTIGGKQTSGRLNQNFYDLGPQIVTTQQGFARDPIWRRKFKNGIIHNFDSQSYLADMDQEGVDVAVCFSGIGLYATWSNELDPDLSAAMCRAYNNWMGDFCKTDSGRLYGMGIIPLQDVELAIAETKRLAELGLRGLVIRPERYNGLALYDEKCDGIWEVAQADNLAVGIHGSFGSRMKGFSSERYEGNVLYDHMIAHPFGQMAVMMDVIAGGVIDRFPKLRVGFFESGLSWIPYWIDRLDEHFEVMGHHTPWLKRLPSEIFAEQCFVSMEADEDTGLRWMQKKGLLDSVLWGSDYPHFDCTYPGAYTAAQETFDAVGEDIAEKVVYENPKRFMAL